MNRHLTTLLIVLLLGGSVVARRKYVPRSGKSSKTPPDLCKDAIDPYRPGIQKSRFFRAAGTDNELTEREFSADRSRPNGFARKFDSWRTLLTFDKDKNKSIDWLEADTYRYHLRKKVLAAYDANFDGKLTAAERTKANTDLARGRIASPPKSSARTPSKRTDRSKTPPSRAASEAERSRLKTKLEYIRKRLYYSPRMAEVRKACDVAERAYENAKRVPAVAEARKPYDAARAAYENAKRKLPEAREYEEAKEAWLAAYRKTPEYKTYSAARDKLRRISRNNPAYDAARRDYEQAKNQYETMKTEIPEYRIYKDARQALDQAAHSLGEYKDSQEAEAAYRKAYETHLTSERKAKDQARSARDKKLDQLVKADPDAAKIYKRIKQIEAARR